MNITRNNYEEFFMLYADNELTAAERKTVEAFIRVNPDLKNELEQFQQFKLNPDDAVVFEGKESLMKQENGKEVISIANYETFFVLYADNELNNSEKAAVEDFVYHHPQLQDNFELIQQARLTADSNIVFENKESLYRKEEDDRVIPFTWWRIAVAALVLLIAGMFWLMQARKNDQPGIVKIKPAVTNPQQATLNKKEVKIIADTNNNTQPEKETLVKAVPVKETQRVKNVQPVNVVKNVLRKDMNRESNHLPALQEQQHKEDVAAGYTDNNNQLKATTVPSLNKSENKAVINTAMAAAADKSVVNQQLVYHSTIESDKAIAEQAVAYNDNSMEVLNTSVNTKKSSLRGFLRKASRMMGKKADPDDDDSKHKSILIGGFEIAVR